MKNLEYKKYKDNTPENTLFRIQTILHEMGLSTVYKWIENEYEGCYSNYVRIYPTQLGTNGKGTDQNYALTSGYAELIERIQNNILYIGEMSEEDKKYGGFIHFPDQKLVSFETIINDHSNFMDHIFEELGCQNKEDKIRVLREFANIKNGTESECLCIPFADMFNNRVVYLPQDLLFCIHGSNGMSAGNTMEEALVQGLAEVFERYVNRKIALEHVCPPSVPRSFLQQIPSLYRIISEIEKNEEYEVVVKDCSLGRGFPVVAIIIINKKKGTFGVKFASHPSFQVALERTLTEAFQGKKLEQFTIANSIGFEKQIQHRDNLLNMMKIGNGIYPKELLVGKPDYEFQPFDLQKDLSNAEMLKRMIELVNKEGYQVFIHDSSYLGFPSYFTIVPGMSEMYTIDWLRVREQQTYVKVVESLNHLQTLTDKEAERVVRYISFKENSMLENQIMWLSGHPFNSKFKGADASTVLLKACCLYQIGDYVKASAAMKMIAEYYEKNQLNGKEIFRCCNFYLYYRAIGITEEETKELIETLFEKTVADQVEYIFSDPKTILNRMYPMNHCYDCEHCEMGELKMCEYQQISKVIRKIKDGLKKKIPDQEKLLKEVRACILEEK